jgi:hypothetical protein
MIVVSHHGLQLDKGLQRDIPPFRSSYQTSTFFAVLLAVDHVECLPGETQKMGLPLCQKGYRVSLNPKDQVFGPSSYSAALQPRLFEVGRNGAVDLSVIKAKVVNSIHAPRPDLQHNEDEKTNDKVESKTGTVLDPWTVFVLICGGLLIVTLLMWTQQRFWHWACRNRRPLVVVTVAVVVAAAAAWVLDGPTALMANHDEGEPFSWTNGVSIWPTEILRLLVVVLCMIFLAKAARDLAVNRDQLGEDFSLHVG